MSEVLSQSQIDALLNAFQSGGPETQTVEAAPEKKYRKYDFSRPRKFTKDRIKMLGGVFENYTRVLNNRLNALLRINCEIEVESIEEQRYFEFSNALSESDVLALAQVSIKDKPEEEAPLMFYMSTSTVLCMIDRMMGGEENMEINLPPNYTYTDLELEVYESLSRDVIPLLGGSWENYVNLSVDYSRTEVNPTLVQLLGVDEIVVIADLRLQMAGGEGRLSICLPGTVLSNIFTEISLENPTKKVSGEDKSEEIFNELRDSDLESVAQLGDTQLSLSDVFHLNVGDVLDLGRSKDSPVHLEIGGYQWFTGRIGTHKKNMAVKIDEVCYQAEQRSE